MLYSVKNDKSLSFLIFFQSLGNGIHVNCQELGLDLLD